MLNFTTTNILIIATLIALTNASGSIEVIVTAPENAYVTTTICTGTDCNGIDVTAHKEILHANVPLRLEDGEYNGFPPAQYDLLLGIYNEKEEIIGSVFQSPETDTAWQSGMIKTYAGFNVTYRFRTLCDTHYFGSQCEKYCKGSPDLHTECSKSGDIKCMHGWTGDDCMTPICSSNCSKNGKCVSPDKCLCNNGFQGADCSQCIAKPGCAHGTCANNQPFTCACQPGYGGEFCAVNLDICERERPCRNGARCKNDANSTLRYQCDCPQGFVGDQCQTPIDSVKCRHYGRQSVCLNGGICYSLDNQSMKCKCKSGFYGKQCESSIEQPPKPECHCQNGGTCQFTPFNTKPACVCATCYRGANCEHLDADCLVAQFKTVTKAEQTLKEEEEVDENSTDDDKFVWLLVGALVVLVVLLLCFGIVMMNGGRQEEKATEVEMVTTPRKSYKVCVIETSPSHQVHQDPPPAYSPPRYKSLPTTDSSPDDCFLHPSSPIIV